MPRHNQVTSVQVVASLNVDTGGPATSVARLAGSLEDCGVASRVVTLDYRGHGPQGDVGRARLVSIPAGAVARHLRGLSPAFARALARTCEGASIVHGHGLWMFPNFYAARAAASSGATLVLSPRGMLDDWARRRARLKKALVWHAWERRNVKEASLLHATSEAEAAALRNLGLAQPIAVIPNGVDLPDLSQRPPRTLLEARFPEMRGKRWMLFLSRVHPKKGVLELLDAWDAARPQGWQLVLAGPELDHFGRAVASDIERRGIAGGVTRTGMLRGALKACALSHAAAFVLPTRSENFGLAIAEALAHELPVITTHAAPWPAIASQRCGWWIGLDKDALRGAIAAATALDPPALLEMGRRGRALVQSDFAWPAVAERMKQAYLWLQGSAERPSFVDAGRLA